MVYESDLVAFLIGIAALSFVIHHRDRLCEIPAFGFLFAGFAAMFIGWIASMVEEIGRCGVFTMIRYFSDTVSAVMVATWCWRLLRMRERNR